MNIFILGIAAGILISVIVEWFADAILSPDRSLIDNTKFFKE